MSGEQKVMPDDHSEVVPLLPIPNRTVKRFCADDSADSRVKVGHRQAIKPETPHLTMGRFFFAYRFPYFPTRSSRLRIFPTFDLGSSSRNSMYLGRL